MSKFVINGKKPIGGVLKPCGNKNAVLKMIPATLLTKDEVVLTNVPCISDVDSMLEIMRELGSKFDYDKENGILKLQTKEILTTQVNSASAKKLRASNMFLGPLLAREGTVTSVNPGGDMIGPREMTAHFDGLTQLGAEVKYNSAEEFTLSGSLRGNRIYLYEPSVTATENVLLAASLTPGKTSIVNAATEPHVQSLCGLLESMGAKIDGIGSNVVHVVGTNELHGTTWKVPMDHIYIATFVIMAAITGGQLLIEDVKKEDMEPILAPLARLGLRTEINDDQLIVPAKQNLVIDDPIWARIKGIYSQPWPCFPTDIMSCAIVLATQTEGALLFFEKMYPGRMFFANYLNGMGASIIIADPHRLVVNGATKLHGMCGLQAPDIRAGVAYVAAALCAEGETTIENVEHIDRGYPNIENTLLKLGADIKRI